MKKLILIACMSASPLLFSQHCYKDERKNYIVISESKDYAVGSYKQQDFYGIAVGNKKQTHFLFDYNDFGYRFVGLDKLNLSQNLKRVTEMKRYECTEKELELLKTSINENK